MSQTYFTRGDAHNTTKPVKNKRRLSCGSSDPSAFVWKCPLFRRLLVIWEYCTPLRAWDFDSFSAHRLVLKSSVVLRRVSASRSCSHVMGMGSSRCATADERIVQLYSLTVARTGRCEFESAWLKTSWYEIELQQYCFILYPGTQKTLALVFDVY